jgi:3-oxoacyl-[acyl-carrier protein] reductase
MRLSVAGLSRDLADSVVDAFRAAGHDVADPADVAVVGVEAALGHELVDLDAAGWSAAIGACRSAFFAVRDAAASMAERGAGGRILVLVPVHAVRPSRGCGAAAVAGSFMTTVAQVAAVELAPRGIRVNVVAVGPLQGHAPERVAEAVPSGRLVTPRDVGETCVFLASAGADAVNGAVVAVDGGYAVTKALGGSPFAR